jgi:hypothetical protein
MKVFRSLPITSDKIHHNATTYTVVPTETATILRLLKSIPSCPIIDDRHELLHVRVIPFGSRLTEEQLNGVFQEEGRRSGSSVRFMRKENLGFGKEPTIQQ